MNSQLWQREILEALHRDGRVEVPELAERRLGISTITIRRDLDQLAGAGALRRVRGGAVTTSLCAAKDFPFEVRAVDGSTLKARLARAAAALIAEGEAVAIDSGTTGAAAAVALAGRRITAMPFSVQGIAALAASSSVTLLLPGGLGPSARGHDRRPAGPADSHRPALRHHDPDLLRRRPRPVGVTAYDLDDAAVKRALRTAAERTILIAEGAKFTRSAMAVVCRLDEVDVLVTDDSAPAEVLADLAQAGVHVVTA